MSWHTFPKWGKCTNCKNVSAWKNCIFLVKTCHKMKANKLILSGREQKNPFGDWVKLYDWFVCLLGKSLESWTAEIERSGLSSRFISLFTTFLQQEKRFIVKLCFCRLTCLECQKKNHGDPKPVFPLGHPHTSSETNYFQVQRQPAKIEVQKIIRFCRPLLLIVGVQTLFSKKDRE